jgi:hypothetical protein
MQMWGTVLYVQYSSTRIWPLVLSLIAQSGPLFHILFFKFDFKNAAMSGFKFEL